MRERMHRGWRSAKGTSEWVYGNFINLFPCEEFPWGLTGIITPQNIQLKVEPESVGDFTGFHDRDGKAIYEGDIVFWKDWQTKGSLYDVASQAFWEKTYIDRKGKISFKDGQWIIETYVTPELKKYKHYPDTPEYIPLSDMTGKYKDHEYPENIRVIGNTTEGETHTPATYAEEAVRIGV